MRRSLLWTATTGLALSGLVVTVFLVRAAMLTPGPRPGGEPLPFNFDELSAPMRLAGALGLLAGEESAAGEAGEEGRPGLPAFLEASFPLLHASLDREFGASGTLLYEWPGDDPGLAPILIAARLEPPPSRLPDPQSPAAGTIDGGFIRGWGASGGTGSALAVLEGIEGLLAAGFAPRRSVILVLARDRSGDGETAESAAVALLDERGLRPAWVLTDGLYLMSGFFPGIRDPVGMVAVVGKRELELRFTARAEPGSAAVPPRRSAAGILGEAVSRLDDAFDPEIVEPNLEFLRTLGAHADPGTRLLVANLWLLGRPFARALTERPFLNALLRTTVVADSILVGAPGRALPSEVSARIRLELAPWDEPELALERLRVRLFDLPVEIEPPGDAFGNASPRGEAGLPRPSDSESFQTIRASIHRSFPDVVAVVPAVTPFPTGTGRYRALTDQVYGFTPFRVDEEALLAVPSSLDRVRVGVYTAAVRFYAELLARGAG